MVKFRRFATIHEAKVDLEIHLATKPPAEAVLAQNRILKRELEKLVKAEVRQLRTKRVNRSNASEPRKKSVTKGDLIKYKKEFAQKNGKERGWVKAACSDFRIARDTLRKRMDE